MKEKTLSRYKKDTWDIFSKYIRLKYSRNGLVKCITCECQKPIREMQAGHYVSRSYLPTLFYIKNVHPQCPQCNIFKKGNLDEYALFLIGTYGNGILEELNMKKWQQVKYTKLDYQGMIKKYKNKIKILEKDKFP